MISKIKFNFALQGSLLIFTLLIIYHFLILMKVIPYEATWGGRLESDEQMIKYEAFSLLLNTLFLLIVLIKKGSLKLVSNKRLVNTLLWLMAILFALNTIGNLLSSNNLETIVFTPITLLLTVFCIRMAREH